MVVKFKTVEEMEEYFQYLDDSICDDERRMVLRGTAIAFNLGIFSLYRKRQARLKVLNHKYSNIV